MIIIEQPVVTEKSLAQAQQGHYTFAVSRKASRTEVKKAIEQLYKVDVTDVRIQNVKGKEVRRRFGIGRENNWKKAFVAVKKGQTIKDFELEQPKEEEKK